MKSKRIQNIGVIGVGGVGGYFGGKLCQHLQQPSEAKIHFIARGQHLDEIRKNGLYLCTAEDGDMVCRPTLATDDFNDLPELDMCLLCVKSYDLEKALTGLKDRLSGETLIIPLLNGIDIYERIREHINDAVVLPACVYIGTHIEAYGKVVQNGGACKILFGKDPQHPDNMPDEIFDHFDRSGIKYTWFDDAFPEIWKKYIFIAAFGLITAAYDKTIGQVMESEELSGRTISIMEEIVALSVKKGIYLPERIINDTYQKGHDFPYETRTSFQRDFAQTGKPDERDLFGAAIIRMSKELGTPSPVTEAVHDRLNLIKKPAF